MVRAKKDTNLRWNFAMGLLHGVFFNGGMAFSNPTTILPVFLNTFTHMVFVLMFANGIVPFSILLTSSIVQDGHGMLPLFSYSVKDALMIKIFNAVVAIIIGLPLLLLGW